MRPIDRDTQLRLVGEANRAPSVHNVQPTRWRFLPGGDVLLFEDRRRRLPIADPMGHDGRISLGATFEGLDLALSRRGLRLETPELPSFRENGPADLPHLALVARTSLAPTGRIDPLAAYVSRRRTFRRSFQPADDVSMGRLTRLCQSWADVVPLFNRPDIEDIAGLHDQCTQDFFAQPGYQAELYCWTRFSPKHPLWNRDGLNADSLGLSRSERLAAMLLFRPRVFEILKTSRLASLLISDAAKTRSASAILILTANGQEDPFLTGRRFYRLWLEVCGAGFSLCPMSALVDSPQGAGYLRQRYAIGGDRRIVNAFRVGLASGDALPPTPRLPAEELLV